MDIVNIREDVNTFIVVLRFLAMPIDRPVDHNWFTTLSYVATSAPLEVARILDKKWGGVLRFGLAGDVRLTTNIHI